MTTCKVCSKQFDGETLDTCKACAKKARDSAYYQRNKEKIKARVKAYTAENSEKVKQYKASYFKANKERLVEKSKQYHQKNKNEINLKRRRAYAEAPEANLAASREFRRTHTDWCREYGVAWRKANPYKVNKLSQDAKARKLQAIPSWETDFDKFVIEEIYDMSRLKTRMTGVEHHVDHIVPLKSKVVCGLHTPINLRVVTAKVNLTKSNKFSTDVI